MSTLISLLKWVRGQGFHAWVSMGFPCHDGMGLFPCSSLSLCKRRKRRLFGMVHAGRARPAPALSSAEASELHFVFGVFALSYIFLSPQVCGGEALCGASTGAELLTVLSNPNAPIEFEQELRIHSFLACVLTASMSGAAIVLMAGVRAPYGRYSSDAGADSIQIPGRVAWLVQELPCVVAAAYYWHTGTAAARASWPNCLLLSLFALHYVNRTFIFPMQMRSPKPTPLFVMLSAFGFCCLNGYLQASYLMRLHVYEKRFSSSPTFLCGLFLFVAGFVSNIHSDGVLRRLRDGGGGYKIPRRGLFKYVSAANFSSEILEWTGFAMATGWSIAGTSFAINTALNLIPRALQHHQWYKDHFGCLYPKERKAVVPFLL